MNTGLKPAPNDFGIEAIRAIATYDLEKLANTMLSDANINCIANGHSSAPKICRQGLPWKDDDFWEKLPNPNSHAKQKVRNAMAGVIQHPRLLQKIAGYPANLFQSTTSWKQPQQITSISNSVHLTKKYFGKWKRQVESTIKQREQLVEQIEQNEKLDNFYKMLKRCQNQKLKAGNCKTSIKVHNKCENNRYFEVHNENGSVVNEFTKRRIINGSACYKNRFKAQQDIIQLQKDKLMQQEKIIGDLKFQNLRKEVDRSIKETEKEIRETLTKCSVKLKYKGRPTRTDCKGADDSIKFHVQSGKAPKILQEIDKRALERESKRKMILERKQAQDRQKKEAVAMEIEKKKTIHEEERKKKLREIRDNRKRQFEIQQQIGIKRQKFLEDRAKADHYYKTKLAQAAFRGLRRLLVVNENNTLKSREFYKTRMKRKVWRELVRLVMAKDVDKLRKADQLYNHRLKEKVFRLWFYVYVASVRHLQVAEDLYDMRLQSKIFTYWHKYTRVQFVLETTNIQRAHKHYHTGILLHYFYQWKMLPAIMELEKAKEEKKRRWRERVWEILPNYTPVVED